MCSYCSICMKRCICYWNARSCVTLLRKLCVNASLVVRMRGLLLLLLL